MKNNILRYFFTSLFFFLFGGEVPAQKVFLPHYTTNEGLPSNHCFYTLQDKKGFIWVATDAGVSRFDGAVFENFTIDDGLPDNQILQLHEDSKGRLWFLALNGQLSFFFNGKIYNSDNYAPLKELNFTSVVVSFFEDSQHRIWFGTNSNMIGMWDGKNTLKFTSQHKTKTYQNSFIYEDKQQNIWAINSFGNFIFSKKDFTIATQNVASASYKTIAHAPNKSVYFLDTNGLHTNDGTTTTTLIGTSKASTNKGFGYIFVDKEGLWLSHHNGVTVIDYNQKIRRLLNGVNVSQVIKDSAGNMWFTTTNGIYKMPQVTDQLYIYQPEKANDYNFKSIIKDPYNRLWLGTNNGNIHILDLKTRKSETINFDNKATFNTIKQFVLDQKNNKILFASDFSLGTISANYPKLKDFNFLKETNNQFYAVKSFAIDSATRLSLAMSSGVLIINNRSNLEFSALNYKEHQNFFKNRSYRVFYDHKQQLWFSNIDGLAQFSASKIYEHYTKHTLLTKRINDIVQLPNGAMALATDGYGIVIYNNQKITRIFNRKNGLHDNIITKLFVKDQYLWAISNTGINRIKMDGDVPRISSFDDISGILADNLNDLYITKDTAYFATNNGLIYFAPDRSLQRTKAPSVYITGIFHRNKQLDLTQKTLIFKPNDQEITINYSAIDFKNKNITYRYRLKHTNNWVETKNRRLALSSLSAGTYEFEICAKNQNSTWGAPAKIKLILLQQFYQTWWFIILMLFIGAYLIYSITVSITQRKKDKEQEALLLKNKILMLEQKALQAMMNPHFVFNVMNSIQHYINTKKTSSANKILTGFARLIRKNLEICTQSYINLEEEIKYLTLYLSLEKARFGDKFHYEIAIDENLDQEDIQIPSMLLQPFIENAIWHGIMPQSDGGKVTISMTKKDVTTLSIKIIDDGVGIDNTLNNKVTNHQSKGMTLIRDRISLLNQIEAKSIHLEVKQNGKKGTIVSLLFPLAD